MSKKLETKDLEFRFTVGGEADAGQFSGYASVFDMVDQLREFDNE